MVHSICTVRIPHRLESAGLVHHLHPHLSHAVILRAHVFHLEVEREAGYSSFDTMKMIYVDTLSSFNVYSQLQTHSLSQDTHRQEGYCLRQQNG